MRRAIDATELQRLISLDATTCRAAFHLFAQPFSVLSFRRTRKAANYSLLSSQNLLHVAPNPRPGDRSEGCTSGGHLSDSLCPRHDPADCVPATKMLDPYRPARRKLQQNHKPAD